MNKSRLPRRPKPKPISIVNDRFAAALKLFGAALLETSHIAHSTIKGGKREDAFRKFIQDRLPKRYGVASGELVDLFNASSPQLDVLIYNQARDFSFSDGEVHILPAEALLASIEVKSTLNKSEVLRCSEAARKLRALQPFRAKLGGRDIKSTVNNKKIARYYHCVFAYDTDISEANWVHSEASRFLKYERAGEHLIDAVYVLNKGLLNLSHGRGRPEDADGSAITTFYFSILNFIEREGGRRPQTPYSDYASRLNGRQWRDFK